MKKVFKYKCFYNEKEKIVEVEALTEHFAEKLVFIRCDELFELNNNEISLIVISKLNEPRLEVLK